MIPMSTITPIAIAIPDNATIFASTPKNLISMKVISTPAGKRPAMITDALRLRTRTIITIMLMRISCESADPSVPIVSLIRVVLS